VTVPPGFRESEGPGFDGLVGHGALDGEGACRPLDAGTVVAGVITKLDRRGRVDDVLEVVVVGAGTVVVGVGAGSEVHGVFGAPVVLEGLDPDGGYTTV
jgi:hypothetical protein